MKETIVIDWVQDIVEPWFNSQNFEGGFITVVTKYGLFNNLTDIGVISVYADGSFQRPPIRKEVRHWFKRRLKYLKKDIDSLHPDARVLLFNGCTPQQEISGRSIEMFKSLVMKDKERYFTDNDGLLRLAGRFKAHFINESPTILFPEPFFNVYMDDMWKFCVTYTESHFRDVKLIGSDQLTPQQMFITATGFYPARSVVPYIPPVKEEDNANLVVLRESNSWFDAQFLDAKLEFPETTPVQQQAINQAAEDFKNNDLTKAI